MRSAVLGCCRCGGLVSRYSVRSFSSSASLSSTPSSSSSSFISRFELIAGPLPSHVLLPSSSAPRPIPPTVTRSVTRLPSGVTRIQLDIGVRDAPNTTRPTHDTDNIEAELEAQWRKNRLKRGGDQQQQESTKPKGRTFSPSAGEDEGLDWVPCILLVPPRPSSSLQSNPLFPAVLCLHQTTVPPSVGKDEPTSPSSPLSYATDLTSRGYVTLSPDYPFFGSYHPSLSHIYSHYSSITAKALVNHLHCVDLLSHYPLVNPTRIGAIGHSLGASNALFSTLYDPRITSVISSAGFTSHQAYALKSRWHAAGRAPSEEEVREGRAYKGDMSGWARKDKYMPWIEEKYGNDWRRMPWQWSELIDELRKRGKGVFISAPKRDLIFDWEGVRDSVKGVRGREGKDDDQVVIHPEGVHEFTADARVAAYDWLDRRMGNNREGVQEERQVHGVGAAW